MDINRLNILIKKVQAIGTEPLSERKKEEIKECITEIKLQYGSFLLEKLFDIYDDYFSDCEIKSIEEYLTVSGVAVEGDDFDEVQSRLTIQPFPLRFQVEGTKSAYKEVVWSEVEITPSHPTPTNASLFHQEMI